MNVLVTGGAGYIGSHAVKRLLTDGHLVVCLDNLSRGHRRPMELLRPVAPDRLVFVEGDIRDEPAVLGLLRNHAVDTVMHFAALAYVGESVDEPLRYYHNNAAGALSLLRACDEAGIGRFVFSSTCATYGQPRTIPVPETEPLNPLSPYGRSKLHVEHMLADHAESCRRRDKPFAYAALRYFNVAGADPDGLLGEDHDPETHLIPVVCQAALGLRDGVTIFGTDYPTPDGTCIRDYIHVTDLIDAHVRVMDALRPGDAMIRNLGIGRGYSVRQIIESVRRVSGASLSIAEGERRAGDTPQLYADPTRIREDLEWRAAYTDIDRIVETAWIWFKAHPRGYAE